MPVQTKETERSNGYDGNGLLSELEHLPTITPDWLAEQPAWMRNPLQKARALFLMVEKKTSSGTYSIRDGIVHGLLAAFVNFWNYELLEAPG